MKTLAIPAKRTLYAMPEMMPIKLAGIICEIDKMLETLPKGEFLLLHSLMIMARHSANLALNKIKADHLKAEIDRQAAREIRA